MPRSTKDYVQDLLKATEAIIARTDGLSEADFFANPVLVDAVLFNFVTIGEACNHLPDDLRARHADVEWGVIVAMRNRIVHGYWEVNPNIIWETIQQNLPELRDQITALLQGLHDEE